MNLSTIEIEENFGHLNANGWAIIKNVLSNTDCELIKKMYVENLFRTTINMKRYRFGSGEYKYFRYPLPPVIQEIRTSLYEQLRPLAQMWSDQLHLSITFPHSHEEFINECQQVSQSQPTPLILKYLPGDFNTLHQDIYGEKYFPLQAIIPLNQYGEDFNGGEIVMTEQIPRAQSQAIVITPDKGDILIITTQFRPKMNVKGSYRVHMKHGVSKIKNGERYTLGIIFHDAQ